MHEKKSKPRSRKEIERERVQGAVKSAMDLQRKDLDNLTSKELREVKFGLSKLLAQVVNLHDVRREQSHR